VLYRQNSELTISTAESTMDRVSNDTVVAVHGLLDPISHSVDLGTSLGRAEQQSLPRPENWRTLIEMFQQFPDAYNLYYGFAQDGGFLQVARLSPGLAAFGPQNRPPPPDARYVVRTIDRGAGDIADTYLYYAADGTVTRVERAPSISYDPRERPWYRDALAADGVTSSAIYIFTGTDRPGITLSRRVVTDDGVLIGAFGIDLTTPATDPAAAIAAAFKRELERALPVS
jgi:adenylate cyclase